MIRYLVALLILVSLPAHADWLGRDYFEIRSVAHEVLERWPSEEYIYVGVGRSPVAVMALLEALGHEVFHLPLSEARKWNYETYSQYLNEYLPPRIASSNKKLLYIDFTVAGSFKNIYELSKRYFKDRFDFALMSMPIHKWDNSYWFKKKNWINIGNRPVSAGNEDSLVFKLTNEKYEELSPYFNSNLPPSRAGDWNELQHNPLYEELKEEVLRKYGLPDPLTRYERFINKCSEIFNSFLPSEA